MAQPLWNEKKMMASFLQPIIHLHITERTINTNICTTTPQTGNFVRINANTRSHQDVITRCKQSRLKGVLHSLHLMDNQGVSVDFSTYVSLLQDCINKKTLPDGKLVHAHIIQTGFRCQDIFLGNTLLNMYVKCGSLGNARRVLHEMPERNVVSWTALIAAYVKHGLSEGALTLFYQMPQTGIQPNHFTFASVLPACANVASLEYGMEVHEEIIRSGFQSDMVVENALVDMYAKCGNVDNARHVFDKMIERNVVSWTAMIAGYAHNGYVEEALKLFRKMPQRNVVSWNAMIGGCAMNGFLEEALKLFKKMPDRDLISWTTMIAGYAQNGCVEKAMKLFKKMPERDVVSWNAMIAGYAQNGYGPEALTLFYRMQRAGIQPNETTFASVLPACANLAVLEHGVEIHQEIIRYGFQYDAFVGSALVDMYAKCGSIVNARNVFDNIADRNVVLWTAMIAGYAQNGYFYEALRLFQQMQLTGMKPNSDTFASILPACANLAALEHGKMVHEDIIRSEFQSDVFVGSALVDMYAKCGSIADASNIFDRMPKRNVVSWNAMITGYAMHGCGKEALKLFEQMQQSNTNPNHVTFVGLLSACCHAGLVDDGWRYFHCMNQYYRLTPVMEHYCCMVDLLGRAGHLDDAHDFIEKMPIKPDAAVWGSLLGACRTHNDIELGECVAERIFELDPKHTAPYVLLSNIYAAVGRWDGIEKVRKMMKDRRVQKKPGCSWIEVNKEVHTFVVGDR
eukprot:Gb_04381 [translate_table: standard]